MRFAIQGTDRNTGRDVDVVIEAGSRSEAATTAMAQGIVVATINVIDDGPAPLEPPPELPRPKYPAIHTLARVYRVLAYVCLGLGNLLAVVVCLMQTEGAQPPLPLSYAIVFLAAGVSYWIVLLSVAEGLILGVDIEYGVRRLIQLAELRSRDA